MVGDACNSNPEETEARGSQVSDQHGQRRKTMSQKINEGSPSLFILGYIYIYMQLPDILSRNFKTHYVKKKMSHEEVMYKQND